MAAEDFMLVPIVVDGAKEQEAPIQRPPMPVLNDGEYPFLFWAPIVPDEDQ